MIKMIVSDVDGTLLEKGKEIIDINLSESIKKLKDKGMIFAVASGRHLSELKKIMRDDDDIYYIASDGGCIEYKGKIIYDSPIDDYTVDKYKENYIFQSAKDVYYIGESESIADYLKQRYKENFKTKDIKGVIKIIKFGAGYSETPPMTYEIYKDKEWCEWIKIGTSKGKAVQYLQKLHDIKIGETLVIGDNYNDLSMMRCGGERVCMSKSPQTLKSISDRVCYNIKREIESIGGRYE